MAREVEPYGRDEFRNALIANAAAKPFNVAVLVGVMAAGVAVSGPVLVCVLVALAVYAAACARTFFDSDEADRVLARERAERRKQLTDKTRRLDPATLAPPVRRHLLDAREREQRIRDAIERAELPYTEVTEEVDGFVRVMEQTAGRAQLLYDALADTPIERVQQRLEEVTARSDPAGRELAEALEHQLAVQHRMQAQLLRFYDEMERIVVELDTVRGTLVSLSASTDAATQQQLASEVRALRERMGAVAHGISEAYEQPAGSA
jgi:chromosome segregation ATPase